MVMWLLSADVWFWQLPIHPHTHGLQSVKFSKMWHLTSAYMKCVYGWAYPTSQPNFLGWIVYQIFLPMVLRKRALRNMQRNGQPRMNSRYRGYKFISYILSDSVWVNLSENMVRAFIQPIRKAKRLFHVWVERFDQSQRTHQKQPCFR